MGSMMAYRATVFMVFFNYAIAIANFLASYMFPINTPHVQTSNVTVLDPAMTSIFSNFTSMGGILGFALVAGKIGLFAFSLLIPTIPFVFAFFALSGFITEFYVSDLPIDWVFKTPIMMGVAIIYYVGISQYAARSTFQGS